MKSRWFQMRRVLAFVLTVSPLFVITAWGLLLALRPSASLAGQSSTGEIGSFLGNLCLQPINESNAQDVAIVQQPCNGSAAQQWTKVQVSGEIYHYVNGLSGLCLDARGGAANHTPVQQWTCNKISNENWSFGITNNVLSSAVSNTFSHCIATPGTQDGLAMELRACDTKSPAQIWTRPPG